MRIQGSYPCAHVLKAYIPLLKATLPRTFDAQDVLVSALQQDVANLADSVIFILLFELALLGIFSSIPTIKFIHLAKTIELDIEKKPVQIMTAQTFRRLYYSFRFL